MDTTQTPVKLHIRSGDKVKVISGNHKGKTGTVSKVIIEKQRAIVEGVNIVKKHVKPTNTNPKGGIVEKEASIHVSNLMLIDPKTGVATRIGRRKNEKTGKLERYSKKTGEVIKNG
jgi:large subunit ribosomal protein L24